MLDSTRARCLALALALSLFVTGCAGKVHHDVEGHMVIGCAIFASSGQLLRQFPGQQCHFFSDGSFFSRDRAGLSFYDAQSRQIWFKKMHTHHLLNVNRDGKALVSSSVIRDYKGEPTRFDVLNIVNVHGEIEGTYDFFEHLEELEALWPMPGGRLASVFDWDTEAYPGVRLEYSHANSFYEIPDNPSARVIPALAQGGFIVNVAHFRRILVFDQELKRVVWSLYYGRLADPPSSVLHDVQVLSNGNLLFYSNRARAQGRVFSTLNEYDPLTRRTVWRFQAEPPEAFNADVCGGVQLLRNGNVLYSDITNGGEIVEITREGKEISRLKFHQTDPRTGKPAKIQDAKRYDLTDFLQHNRL